MELTTQYVLREKKDDDVTENIRVTQDHEDALLQFDRYGSESELRITNAEITSLYHMMIKLCALFKEVRGCDATN